MTEPWELTIKDASVLIISRKLGAVELLDSVLQRLDKTESYAQAWAYVDDSGAREAAGAADRLSLGGGSLGPLHGIPLGIKDVIDVRNMPTEAGSGALLGNIARSDAGAVRQLRHSGAVILGKTRTHEFAFGQGTPPSRNPRDPERYAGGSSIGSGVAVAVGSTPGAVGTDTGGSVRNPASINGLVGIKPSFGLISGSGLLNVSHTLDQIGPIARTVTDAAKLLECMAGPEKVSRLRKKSPHSAGPAIRLGIDRRIWDDWAVTQQVKTVLECAIDDLQELGIDVIDLPLPQLSMALPASLAISLSEAADYHRARLEKASAHYLQGTRIMLETGSLIPSADVQLAREVQEYLRSLISGMMEEAGVAALISPTLPAVAPVESNMDHALTGEAGNNSLSSALQMLTTANLTGMPALSLPCGFAQGQPVGMHLMGPIFSEYTLFSIANTYETATEWKRNVPVRNLPVLTG